MLFCPQPSERQFSKCFHSREEILCTQKGKKKPNQKTPKHFIVKANFLYIILKNVKVIIFNSTAFLHVITVCF